MRACVQMSIDSRAPGNQRCRRGKGRQKGDRFSFSWRTTGLRSKRETKETNEKQVAIYRSRAIARRLAGVIAVARVHAAYFFAILRNVRVTGRRKLDQVDFSCFDVASQRL